MSTWQQDRRRDFADMLSEWGTTMSKGGVTIPCQKTPTRIARPMGSANFMPESTSTFDVIVEDFDLLNLGPTVQFQCEGTNYQISTVRRDSSDPIVQFDAAKTK